MPQLLQKNLCYVSHKQNWTAQPYSDPSLVTDTVVSWIWAKPTGIWQGIYDPQRMLTSFMYSLALFMQCLKRRDKANIIYVGTRVIFSKSAERISIKFGIGMRDYTINYWTNLISFRIDPPQHPLYKELRLNCRIDFLKNVFIQKY
jgi:hypothetical protein